MTQGFQVQIQGTSMKQILHQLTNVVHASQLSVCLSCCHHWPRPQL